MAILHGLNSLAQTFSHELEKSKNLKPSIKRDILKIYKIQSHLFQIDVPFAEGNYGNHKRFQFLFTYIYGLFVKVNLLFTIKQEKKEN